LPSFSDLSGSQDVAAGRKKDKSGKETGTNGTLESFVTSEDKPTDMNAQIEAIMRAEEEEMNQ